MTKYMLEKAKKVLTAMSDERVEFLRQRQENELDNKEKWLCLESQIVELNSLTEKFGKLSLKSLNQK